MLISNFTQNACIVFFLHFYIMQDMETYCSVSTALLITVIVFIISNFPKVEALRMSLVIKQSNVQTKTKIYD
jgi:hypothetical protein